MDGDDAQLAAYQHALLDVLAHGGDPHVAKAELTGRCPTFAAYVQDFDPRMVKVGMHLTAKWARRC